MIDTNYNISLQRWEFVVHLEDGRSFATYLPDQTIRQDPRWLAHVFAAFGEKMYNFGKEAGERKP